MDKHYYELLKIDSMLEILVDELVRDKYFCPVCQTELRLFLPTDGGGKVARKTADCPVCRCAERDRLIWLLWEQMSLFDSSGGEKKRVLHMGPEKVFVSKFTNNKNIDYYPCDIDADKFGVLYREDMTHLSFDDEFFDVIMCSNVIEHIRDEQQALSELYRVLKKDGVAFIDAPVFYDLEETIENLPGIDTPELEKEMYGWPTHVRKYGKDYVSRLRKAGFRVEQKGKEIVNEQLQKKYGLVGSTFSADYKIHICRKGSAI